MFRKLLKTIKRYVKNGRFRVGLGDKNMTFLYKATINLCHLFACFTGCIYQMITERF